MHGSRSHLGKSRTLNHQSNRAMDPDLNTEFSSRTLTKNFSSDCPTFLSREGYEVRTALDGFEALDVLRDSLPDLLISALRMPYLSDFDLLSVMRRRFPSIP